MPTVSDNERSFIWFTSIFNIIILLFLLAIAVPYSRYKSDCHTPIQVISGCVLGVIIGLFYTMVIDKMWLSKYPKYINDKNIFYGLWFY